MYNVSMSNKPCPSEDAEQMTFVQWLDKQRIPHWHTNNEMWTKSWKQKQRSKDMGVKSGIPDLFLVFNEGIVGIEMKRQYGGVVSPTQKYWGSVLEGAGVQCYVCRGCQNAIETVEHLLAHGFTKMELEETYWEFVARIDAEKSEKKLKNQQKKLKNLKNEDIF